MLDPCLVLIVEARVEVRFQDQRGLELRISGFFQKYQTSEVNAELGIGEDARSRAPAGDPVGGNHLQRGAQCSIWWGRDDPDNDRERFLTHERIVSPGSGRRATRLA